MKIEIDKKQMEYLIYALNIAEWITDNRPHSKSKENKMFTSLLKKFTDIAHKENLFNWLVESEDQHDMNNDKMDWMYYNIIEPYSERGHLDYIAAQLAWNDMHKKYSEKELDEMDRDKRFIEMDTISEVYMDKFEEYGLSGLRYEEKNE